MSDFILGLDLGQVSDYTALSVVEVVRAPGPNTEQPLHLRHLARYVPGTSYAEIVRRVTAMRSQPPLKGSTLVVDATGVGPPVVDLFKEAGAAPVAVYITGGNEVTREGRRYGVPKRDLVTSLQVVLQNERLKAAPGLKLWPQLRAEMQNFRVKISLKAGHDSYEHWRERDHDDLVLSLALAVWYAEQVGEIVWLW